MKKGLNNLKKLVMIPLIAGVLSSCADKSNKIQQNHADSAKTIIQKQISTVPTFQYNKSNIDSTAQSNMDSLYNNVIKYFDSTMNSSKTAYMKGSKWNSPNEGISGYRKISSPTSPREKNIKGNFTYRGYINVKNIRPDAGGEHNFEESNEEIIYGYLEGKPLEVNGKKGNYYCKEKEFSGERLLHSNLEVFETSKGLEKHLKSEIISLASPFELY